MDDTDTYYLVLDWVERNLDDVLKTSGPWDSWDRLATDIALPLIDALAYTHLKQIEHRDIKPANVLISERGAPLLADFGIAKIRGEEQAGPPRPLPPGTPSLYAPPELNADIRYVRDVYSVGVLLIQCMTKEVLKDMGGVKSERLRRSRCHPMYGSCWPHASPRNLTNDPRTPAICWVPSRASSIGVRPSSRSPQPRLAAADKVRDQIACRHR